jgi:hypothetical protein
VAIPGSTATESDTKRSDGSSTGSPPQRIAPAGCLAGADPAGDHRQHPALDRQTHVTAIREFRRTGHVAELGVDGQDGAFSTRFDVRLARPLLLLSIPAAAALGALALPQFYLLRNG